jgi:dTDP-4-dehydrorhamnose 3,5-epimerase-like enzyme
MLWRDSNADNPDYQNKAVLVANGKVIAVSKDLWERETFQQAQTRLAIPDGYSTMFLFPTKRNKNVLYL